MKYILNESPVRTTNNFRVNNVQVDLEIPNEYSFHDYEINNLLKFKSTISDNFETVIGLKHDKYKNTIINLDKNYNDLISIKYIFNGTDNLVDNIDINIDENVCSQMIIEFLSADKEKHFHNGNINICAKKNSNLNLTIICELNEQSINLLSSNIYCEDESKVLVNLIDLSGEKRIYNFQSTTLKNATSRLNNIYIGKNNNLIDLNYNYINMKENCNNNIEVQGILDDNAYKTFRGIIDFIKGSKNSIGYENESCLLLSNTSISKSLPVILCGEEEVCGNHSVSSGKIDDNKLFYLMCRGIEENEAKKLIIKSRFNVIIKNIPDIIQEYIVNKIDHTM